jgi:hypothetical protein
MANEGTGVSMRNFEGEVRFEILHRSTQRALVQVMDQVLDRMMSLLGDRGNFSDHHLVVEYQVVVDNRLVRCTAL